MRSARPLRFFVALFAALVVAVWLGAGLRISKLSAADVAKMIDQELGPHPSVTEVAAFLDRHKFERSEYIRNERRMGAMVRDTCYGLLVECDLLIAFKFDENEKLLSRSVDESLTSG